MKAKNVGLDLSKHEHVGRTIAESAESESFLDFRFSCQKFVLKF